MVGPVTRASSSGRWIPCPESAWLEPGYPDLESAAAREGTAAHEMAELVLTNQFAIEELVNRPASNGVVMTGEMVPYVQTYVDHVLSHGVGFWVEKDIVIETRVGDIPGRCDGASFGFDLTSGHLFIDDFKYGYRPVEIFENWQQLIYAIGMYLKIGPSVQTITMSVIQPRCHHHEGPVRSWTITADQLVDYMHKIVAAKEAVHSPNRQRRTGPHCRDCKALADCPAAMVAGMNAIDVTMQSLPDTKSPQEISRLLDLLTSASKTIDHLLSGVTAKAEAMIKNGQPIPDYIFEPGKGNRKFKNDDEAIAIAKALGYDITQVKAKSPYQAEQAGLPKNIVDQLTTYSSTSPKLKKRNVSLLADKYFK